MHKQNKRNKWVSSDNLQREKVHLNLIQFNSSQLHVSGSSNHGHGHAKIQDSKWPGIAALGMSLHLDSRIPLFLIIRQLHVYGSQEVKQPQQVVENTK